VVAQLVEPPHPVVACAEQATTAITEALGYEPVFMDAEAKRAALLAISTHERRVAALKLKVMAASADVADADGARDVAAWLAPRTQAEPRPLRAEQRLAVALDKRWTQVAAGMAAGGVSFEQAQVIVGGLDELPDRLGIEVLTRAEAHLVELAQKHNPTELRILVRRILELAAPEIAEGEEARRLEEEEKRARDHSRLSLKPLGDGSTRISGLIPDEAGQRLATYLHAFTNPRKHPEAISGEEDRIPYPRQLAHAFCALLEHLDPDQLPVHGGDATTLMVTIGLDSLTKDLGTGTIIGGEALSATAIRRLACTAKIIPAVLGGNGEVLDLGRSRRLFSPAQRKAMALRDPTCFGEGCSIPAKWTEAHHLKPWSEGGKTDIKDGRLGCSYHHHLIHDPDYTHEILPNGKIRFHRKR
jgi:hypothetical protein